MNFVVGRVENIVVKEKKMLVTICLTHSQTTNFIPFQIERVCRRNFEVEGNGGRFFEMVENTVGKGEIARYKQFLLFPQCFLKICTADM